jgi:hypothetical protein
VAMDILPHRTPARRGQGKPRHRTPARRGLGIADGGLGVGQSSGPRVSAGEPAGFGAHEGIGGGESAGTRDPPLAVAWRRRELQRVGSSSAGGWGTGRSRPLATRRGRRLQSGAGGKMKMCRYTDGVYRRVVHAPKFCYFVTKFAGCKVV